MEFGIYIDLSNMDLNQGLFKVLVAKLVLFFNFFKTGLVLLVFTFTCTCTFTCIISWNAWKILKGTNWQNMTSLVAHFKKHRCQNYQIRNSKYCDWVNWIIEILWIFPYSIINPTLPCFLSHQYRMHLECINVK